MRKITTLILTLILTLSMAGFANAEPANIYDAIKMANDELRAKNTGLDFFFNENIQGKSINEALWAKSKLFSYGTAQEASPGARDFDTGTNQYRYHGYTKNGEKYTNTFFRNDTAETVDINKAEWIQKPWNNDDVRDFVTNVMREPQLNRHNPFNNDPTLLESINLGMENLKLYNPYIQFQRDGKQWQSYVHVLQPPTKFSFGMGRLFREVGGEIRYLTIPLTPLILTVPPDFSVLLEADKFTDVKPGQQVTSTVTFNLNKDHPAAARALLRLHYEVNGVEQTVTLAPLNPADAPDKNGITTFQPGESKTYRYSFTVKTGASKIIARVNPADTSQDKNWKNNRDEAPVVQEGYDMKVAITAPKTATCVGNTIAVKAKIKITRKDNIPGSIKIRIKGTGGTTTLNNVYSLAPGQSKELDYSFPASPGTYTLKAEAWPAEVTDIYPPDNTAQTTVTVNKANLPPTDGGIRTNLGGW